MTTPRRQNEEMEGIDTGQDVSICHKWCFICNCFDFSVSHIQRSAKRYANVAKQDPGRGRQNR